MRRWLTLAGSVAASALLIAQGDTATRTIYATVVDNKHAPITGLAAADVSVTEGGKRREIVRVEPADVPIDLAIFVDDDGRGGPALRDAVGALVKALAGHARMAIVTTIGQPSVRQDFSTDAAAVGAAVQALPVVGRTGASHLPQMLTTVADTFRKGHVARPAMVAVAEPHTSITYTLTNVTNAVEGETSSATAEDGPTIDAGPGESGVRDAVLRSRATLYVFELDNDAPLPPGVRTDAVTDRAAQYPWPVDLPRLTGGRADRIALAQGLRPLFDRLADELLHQYAITYKTPDPSADATLEVQVKRSGATVTAPRHVH